MRDLIGYDEIIEDAMRSVIGAVLRKIEKKGLPGSHYFMITFLTKHSKVSIPKQLLEKYPEEMTIALQHQFKSLTIEEDLFKVSLSFNNKFEKLTIPYRAITSFSDPSVNFGMRFNATTDDLSYIDSDVEGSEKEAANIKKSNIDLTAKVISLDDFRKTKNSNNDA